MSDTQKNKKPNVPNLSVKREQKELQIHSAERETNVGRNVPNLRFPGFSGEWECKQVRDIAPLQRGFDLPSQSLKEGIYPVVYSNGIMNYHSEYKCEAPGIVTGRSGTIGKLTFIESGKYWPHNTSLWVTDFKNNDSKFVYYFYEHLDLCRFSSGSGVPTLNRNDVHAYKAFIPSLTEQNKIASFLSLLDARISIQNKVIEDYTTLEKEIQHQVFSRINAPHVPLSSISERVSERNSTLESDNVLTISAREGLVSQLEFFNKSVASENLSNYYLLRKGDFAYNKSYSSDYPWGAIKYLERYNRGVLSPLYFCFRPNKEIVDIRYLQFFFDTNLWHKHIAEIAVEGARNHGLLNMTVVDFYTMPILLPTMNEQKEIAEKLSAIREKRVVEESIYRLFLQQKRYLLEKLFI